MPLPFNARMAMREQRLLPNPQQELQRLQTEYRQSAGQGRQGTGMAIAAQQIADAQDAVAMQQARQTNDPFTVSRVGREHAMGRAIGGASGMRAWGAALNTMAPNARVRGGPSPDGSNQLTGTGKPNRVSLRALQNIEPWSLG